MERYLIALSRKGEEPAEDVERGAVGGGEGGGEGEEEEKMDRERVQEGEEERCVHVCVLM